MTPSGQRFSQRLRAKRLQHSSAPPPVPAAPPPPPLPPVCVKREDTCGPNVPLKVTSVTDGCDWLARSSLVDGCTELIAMERTEYSGTCLRCSLC